MSKNVVGIDIASGGVRAVEVRNGHTAHPVVVKHHFEPLPAGSVDRGEVLDVRGVSEAIAALWKAARFSSKEVVMGIGGTAVMSRELALPRAPLARLRESLPFHVEGVLPVPVSETILDYYPISESVEDDGPVVHGLLIAAIRDAVSANVAAVTQAGLTPTRVDLVPFALARAITPTRSATGTAAIVSVGSTVTTVIITNAGVPHFVRILPLGGDDLSVTSAVPDWAADLALLTAGGPPEPAPPAQPVGLSDEGTRRKVDEFVASIRTTAEYYLNSRWGGEIDRFILTGSGSRAARLDLALAESLHIEVEWAPEFPDARFARGVGASADTSAMTTAYGLALGARR